MDWSIQDAFNKCGGEGSGFRNCQREEEYVGAVADTIRELGYTVNCGVWEDAGYCKQTDMWEDPADKQLAAQANHYVIFSIRRPTGEFVYGSVEPPNSLMADDFGCRRPSLPTTATTGPSSTAGGRHAWEMNECRWEPDEVAKRWPLSGHKSLPHYLKNHKDTLVLGPNTWFSHAQWGGVSSSIPGRGWMTVREFVTMFYLDKDKRSESQSNHIDQLISYHEVSTIANTLPADIVEALKSFPSENDSHWEFIEPSAMACPVDEGGGRLDDSTSGTDTAAVAAACPTNDCEPIKSDKSGSSSEDDDDE